MTRERRDVRKLPASGIARGKHAIAPLFRQGLNSQERVRIEGSAALAVAVRAPRKKIGETCYLLAGRGGRAGADGGNKACTGGMCEPGLKDLELVGCRAIVLSVRPELRL